MNAPGAVVQDGEVLAELACAGERLQAEVNVTPSGTGRIEPGQHVRLLYDAFPYQRYGIKHGTVRWVSPASAAWTSRASLSMPATPSFHSISHVWCSERI